jgi:hypothetical protein
MFPLQGIVADMCIPPLSADYVFFAFQQIALDFLHRRFVGAHFRINPAVIFIPFILLPR